MKTTQFKRSMIYITLQRTVVPRFLVKSDTPQSKVFMAFDSSHFLDDFKAFSYAKMRSLRRVIRSQIVIICAQVIVVIVSFCCK